MKKLLATDSISYIPNANNYHKTGQVLVMVAIKAERNQKILLREFRCISLVTIFLFSKKSLIFGAYTPPINDNIEEKNMQRESFSERNNIKDTSLETISLLYPVYTSRVSTGSSKQRWKSTYETKLKYENNAWSRDEINFKYENGAWTIERILGNKLESKEDHDVKMKECEMIPFSTLVLIAILDNKADLELLEIFDQHSQQKIIQCLIDFYSAQFFPKPGQRSIFNDETDGTAKQLFTNAKYFFDLIQPIEYLPKPTFVFDENTYPPKQPIEGVKQSETEKSPTDPCIEEESSGCFSMFWETSPNKNKERGESSTRPTVEEIKQKETPRQEGVFDLEM